MLKHNLRRVHNMDRRLVLPTVSHLVLDQLDQARRQAGRLLDGLGAGPQPTRSHILIGSPGMRLRHFQGAAENAPAALLVPAPIKRWYIWDLEPQVSVVTRCLAHGLDVYLVEWTDPGAGEQDFGLEEYADRMLRECVEAVTARTGQARVLLIGHSLGGTLAAIFAARHPDLVARIALLEAPLHFGPDAGALAPIVAMAPHAGWFRAPERAVPGSFLDLVSALAAPVSFQLSRYADLVLSLGDPALLATHMRVERWTLDEFPLPGRLFEDVVEQLYRRDEFMAGTLSVTGQRVGPRALTAPMLNVVNPHSRVIPPESILPFHQAAASARKQLMRYRGDIGVAVQHVGVLVGRNAHRLLWPMLLRWLHRPQDGRTDVASGPA
jgi:polyhydroxyalkanoate synthase subunit PhaC